MKEGSGGFHRRERKVRKLLYEIKNKRNKSRDKHLMTDVGSRAGGEAKEAGGGWGEKIKPSRKEQR